MLLATVAQTAWAETINTSYKDADGTIKYVDATVITKGGDYTDDYTTLASGWYVVTGSDVDFKGALECGGDLHLIIADGAKMTVTHTDSHHSIDIRGALTIYGQASGTGELVVRSSIRCGIYVIGDITINGGKIDANALKAICSYDGDITINGGDITAAGESDGIYTSGKDITINGGKVHATHSGRGYSICSSRYLNMGYTNEDDEIYADSFKSSKGGTVKDGQMLRDANNNRYSGTLTKDEISALSGKTLTPSVSVAYIDANGDMQHCYDFIELTGSTSTDITPLSSEWYVVRGDISYSGSLVRSDGGSVNLILCDGSSLTATGLQVSQDGGNLTIYSQSGNTGKLIINRTETYGILTNGNLTINGGIVNVTSTGANAISSTGSVTINGGTVKATTTADYKFGICGESGIILGWRSATDHITANSYFVFSGNISVKAGLGFYDGANIYSGTLTNAQISAIATKTLTPTGITANAECTEFTIQSAKGWNDFCDYLQDVDTWNYFTGKTVKLGADIEVSRVAGSSKHDFSGTFDGDGHKLTVNLTGTGNYTAPFYYLKPQSDDESVTIRGLKVDGTINTASKYAGGLVGGCHGKVNIIDCVSDVTINSSVSGDGTHGGLVGRMASSGTLSFDGCAFTGKMLTTNGTANCGGFLGWTMGTVNINNCLYAPAVMEDGETEVGSSDSKAFARLNSTAVMNINNSFYTRTLGTAQGIQARSTATLPTNIGEADEDYRFVKAYAKGLKCNDLYYMVPEALTLANASANDVESISGYFADVTLADRSLTKDGTWNTLCLPFSLSAEQIAESPLAGATIKEMDSSTSLSNDGLLTLNFKNAQSIEAGKAYIVKWETKGENIVNPLFHGVTISNAAPAETESTEGKVKFVGQYSPFAIDNDNINEILFIGSGNKIGYSKNPRQLKSCRAHFWVQPNGFSAGARVINIDLGDGVTTSINLVEADDENGDGKSKSVYSIDGRKVQGEPTQKGVYVVNGKKVVK